MYIYIYTRVSQCNRAKIRVVYKASVLTISHKCSQNGYWAPICVANSAFYLAIGEFGV